MSIAIGFIEIQHAQGQAGAVHPALAWPNRVAMGLDPVLSKDDRHLLGRKVKRGERVLVYFADRNDPGYVYCGLLKPGAGKKGFAIADKVLANEHPSFQATLGATDVFNAVVQLATRQFEEWQSLGSRLLDELDGKTWEATPRSFIGGPVDE